MYNRLVVPLNRYNNFVGSLHSLDVFLGKEGATQLSARDSHRLTPVVATRSRESFYSQKQSIPRKQLSRLPRYSILTVEFARATKAKKDMEGKKLHLIDVGVSGKIGETDRRRDLDPIKMQGIYFCVRLKTC